MNLGKFMSDAAQRAGDERYFITALARGLDVLGCFTVTDRVLGNQEISQRCQLPKSTVTRITATLTGLGYLRQMDDAGGRFALGVRTLALGSTAIASIDVRQIARPMLQDLADESRSAVSLAVRDRLSLIYVEVCRSKVALGLTIQVGSRIALARSAIARAYLAWAGETERTQILALARAQSAGLCQAVLDDVARAEEDVAHHGCTTSFGDWQPDVNGIAMAFVPAGQSEPMAINCGGPASQLSPAYLLGEVRPRLQSIVAALSG